MADSVDHVGQTRGVRGSSRNLGSRILYQQPGRTVKLETSPIGSLVEEEQDDGDEEGEGNDDVTVSDDQDYHFSQSPHDDVGHASSSQTDGYPQAEAVDEKIMPNINIIEPIGTTSKPARVSKVSIPLPCVRYVVWILNS